MYLAGEQREAPQALIPCSPHRVDGLGGPCQEPGDVLNGILKVLCDLGALSSG